MDKVGSHYDSSPNFVRAIIGGDLNSSLPRAKVRLNSFLSEYDMKDLSNAVDYTYEDPQTLRTSKIDYFIGTIPPEHTCTRLDKILLAKMGHFPLAIELKFEKVLIDPLTDMSETELPTPGSTGLRLHRKLSLN